MSSMGESPFTEIKPLKLNFGQDCSNQNSNCVKNPIRAKSGEVQEEEIKNPEQTQNRLSIVEELYNLELKDSPLKRKNKDSLFATPKSASEGSSIL